MLNPLRPRRRVASARLALLWLAVAVPAAAQAPRWSVRSSPAADLWFHGLAVIGFTGFGELPLYAPDYAASVAKDKAARGVVTELDRRAPYFRTEFARDSAFEVLHFLPLYFPASEPGALLEALGQVAKDDAGQKTQPGSAERFGAAAVAAALPTAAERRVLGELTAALDGEWRHWYRGVDTLAGKDARQERVGEFERAWLPLEAALGPYLNRYRLTGGIILLTPAVGPDGRLFEGNPGAASDNVLAIAVQPPAADAVFFAVRELCYPAVRRAISAARLPDTDRVTGERLSGRAAVRCGRMLLARYAPDAVTGYETAWLRASGQRSQFTDGFVIPDRLVRALEAELAPR
ncbi:MAG TPA: hypothetical protein VGA78_13490 [Gemmatimonadales bacterium]